MHSGLFHCQRTLLEWKKMIYLQLFLETVCLGHTRENNSSVALITISTYRIKCVGCFSSGKMKVSLWKITLNFALIQFKFQQNSSKFFTKADLMFKWINLKDVDSCMQKILKYLNSNKLNKGSIKKNRKKHMYAKNSHTQSTVYVVIPNLMI